MSTAALFKSLAASALDFLRESVDQLESTPQRSLISFATSIELFLKARLLCEHWTLVYDKPQTADLAEFLKGKFQSVGIKECVSRLAKIGGVEVPPLAVAQFQEIHEHRNKLIHFFHPDLTADSAAETREKILTAELKGWFHLIHLLKREDFEAFFTAMLPDIRAVEMQMRRNRKFLQEKFTIVAPEAVKERNGKPAVPCRFCGYDATVLVTDELPLRRIRCLVCEWCSGTISGHCPDCGKLVTTDYGEGRCEDCDETFGLDTLLDEWGTSQNPKDAAACPVHAHCSECEHNVASVVPFGDGFVCLHCAAEHKTTGYCEYCGEHATGDLEDSFFTGCCMCYGPRYSDDD